MKNVLILEVVRERDIDLLLLEEFHVCQQFLFWFVNRAYKDESSISKLINACHSLTDSHLGESDIAILFSNSNNEKCALLIENKIDAIPQPNQAKRYKERGLKGIKEGKWKTFKTCIVAPQSYLKKSNEALDYDIKITYEKIAEWFKSNSKEQTRRNYKAKMMEEGIEQNRRGYNAKPNEFVSELFLQYWELCSVNYPELGMKKPEKIPARSDWIYFKPLEFSKGIKIVHKMAKGYLDLQISGGAGQIKKIKRANKDNISSGMKVVPAGKSVAIRVIVPRVNRFGKFEEQIDLIKECLVQAKKLVKIGKKFKL